MAITFVSINNMNIFFVNRKYELAFTLIEVAIVLAIAALIGYLTLPEIVPIIKHSKVESTRKQIFSLRSDIIGYAQMDKALPNNLSSMGYPQDAWKNRIEYIPASNATVGNTPDICNATQRSNLGLITLETTEGRTLSNSTIFFLGSSGADHKRKWTNSSSSIIIDSDSDDITQFITYEFLFRKLCI